MLRLKLAPLVAAGTLLAGMSSGQLFAQDSAASSTNAPSATARPSNPVLNRMWAVGMDSSHTYPLAQSLLDSLGPRLTGTPQQLASMEWVIRMYASWGIPARKEQYATGAAWDRGWTHVDLIFPRLRTLEGMMLAWSPGTNGQWVDGEVIVPPDTSENIDAWLAQAKGKYVLVGNPQPTCRTSQDWKQWAQPGSKPYQPDRLPGVKRELLTKLDNAGIAGVLHNEWSRGWGVDKIFSTLTKQVPTVHLSCEDYGLVARMAMRKQKPRIRVNAQSSVQQNQPYFNVIGEIKGTEFPDEYVILSAHFDSWDGATGATDNGTGTIVMMEAMRILKTVYPNPKRTILVGHWNGEEQGLVGSRGYVRSNSNVVKGIRTVLNQDNGTGRVNSISGQGVTKEMISQLPEVLTKDVKVNLGLSPSGGGSDHVAFSGAGAPAVLLYSLGWNYDTYTWHTNRDTFDKINFDDLKQNATLTAMLAYLVSEQSAPPAKPAK